MRENFYKVYNSFLLSKNGIIPFDAQSVINRLREKQRREDAAAEEGRLERKKGREGYERKKVRQEEEAMEMDWQELRRVTRGNNRSKRTEIKKRMMKEIREEKIGKGTVNKEGKMKENKKDKKKMKIKENKNKDNNSGSDENSRKDSVSTLNLSDDDDEGGKESVNSDSSNSSNTSDISNTTDKDGEEIDEKEETVKETEKRYEGKGHNNDEVEEI
jgi:hypothetical protein